MSFFLGQIVDFANPYSGERYVTRVEEVLVNNQLGFQVVTLVEDTQMPGRIPRQFQITVPL